MKHESQKQHFGTELAVADVVAVVVVAADVVADVDVVVVVAAVVVELQQPLQPLWPVSR